MSETDHQLHMTRAQRDEALNSAATFYGKWQAETAISKALRDKVIELQARLEEFKASEAGPEAMQFIDAEVVPDAAPDKRRKAAEA